MNMWIGPVAVLSLLAASLLALFACVRIFRRERRRARKMAVREVQSRLGGAEFRTSAWLVGIPRTHAGRVREKASRVARDAGPEDVLALWEAEGGVLLGRVAGPSFSTEEEASAWVGRASDKLAEAPVAWPGARSEQSVFVIVLASAADPPAQAESLRELRGLLGSDCVGAAFVACPVDERGRQAVSGAASTQLASSPGTLRALSLARYGLGALAVLTAGYAGAALASHAEGWSAPMDRGPQARECVDTPPQGTSGVKGGPQATGAGRTTGALPNPLVGSGAGGAEQTTTLGDAAKGSEGDDAGGADAGASDADAGSADAGVSDADAGSRGAGNGTLAGQGTSGKAASSGKGASGKAASGQGTSGQAGPVPQGGDIYASPPAKSAAPPPKQ